MSGKGFWDKITGVKTPVSEWEDYVRNNAYVFKTMGPYKEIKREGKNNALGTSRVTPESIYTIKTRREIIENWKKAMHNAKAGVLKGFVLWGVSGYVFIQYLSTSSIIFGLAGLVLAFWGLDAIQRANAPGYGRHAWQEDTPCMTPVPGVWNLAKYYIKEDTKPAARAGH